jgi:acetate kinase
MRLTERAMSERIAVLNAGSSSIKFALYEVEVPQAVLFRGQVEQIGISPRLRVTDAGGTIVDQREWPAEGFDHRTATTEILQTAVGLLGGTSVAGIGHRIAHGGTEYAAPILITADVMAVLTRFIPLAPLHQPHNLAAVAAIAEAAPSLAQVACFDTAFHRNQPYLAQLFALPRKFTETGVRRYGFHGLSYEFVTSRIQEVSSQYTHSRIVIAHLGNGASLCAIRDGRSVATTMGFTALDGLMMGTRCGSLDPGVLLYLMDFCGMDARAIENLLYRQSGLLGVSGHSSDMRNLRASPTPDSAEAISLFVYRVIREIGSLVAALGGLDALVFTGGIGENDAATRAEIVEGCHWLRIRLDEARNAKGRGRISTDDSAVAALVVPTDEEQMIARHTASVLGLAVH